jgi:formylglycine-generating enzyme required for sulfatase activity
LRANYLGLTGYRLPTEAEWEYACRAKAATSRSYGESVELLEEYGWYLNHSNQHTWPVGRLKPNDFGFFDLHGNVWNWCQERFKGYAAAEGGRVIDDNEDSLIINPGDLRVARGGAFNYEAMLLRCATRVALAPAGRYNDVGFRPARTFP